MTPESVAAPSRKTSVALIRSWPLTLISALLLPLLLGLGVWQLQRAQEKQQINRDIDLRLSQQPVHPSEIGDLKTYTPVRLQGYYRNEIHYLDNRTREGRVGYEILQVFVSGEDGEGGEQRWLVNRGWMPAPASRDQLPEVTWPRAAKVITGFLYPVPKAEMEMPQGGRIQQLGAGFAEQLDLLRPEWSIRLSADSDTALRTEWQLLNSPPQRHRAYAFQWFAMALALVVLWLIAATGLPQRLRGNHKNHTSPPAGDP